MRNAYLLLENDPTHRVLYDVLKERSRHNELGYTIEHDNSHSPETLAGLAIDYIEAEGELGKIKNTLDRNDLIKSISLMVAAVELMDRTQ